MDIVHDNTMDLLLAMPVGDTNDSENWKSDDSENLYYLPVLATQHDVPLPIDFKRQR